MTEQSDKNGTDTTKGTGRLLLIVVGMFFFGFALVPLYDVFCDITGLNGKTGGKAALSDTMQVDTSRKVKIEFLATLNESMPWEFKPVQNSVTVHPGEPARIEYIAKNLTDKAIIGQAVPSVAPGLAAQYLQKTECFCFTEQILEAGERKEMPVLFVIDPSIPNDVTELALSYTFFIKPGSEASAENKTAGEPLVMNTHQEK